mgnify:FL=1
MAYNWVTDLESGKDTKEMKQLRKKLEEVEPQFYHMAKKILKKQLEIEF